MAARPARVRQSLGSVGPRSWTRPSQAPAPPIPFTAVSVAGRERAYIDKVLSGPSLAADGEFTKLCERWLEKELGTARALLVPSCTAALEMTALLLDIGPGDEVIMPSFTFVATASAFVLRGATPVFVDIRPDTLCLDETAVAAAITPKTRAIVPVHYAGVSCDMARLNDLARGHDLTVVEDAAQALLADSAGRKLGTLGRFGCLSFHNTKNITCGHGGALLLNDGRDIDRPEILRDRGTDRARFQRGDVPAYSWREAGSSFYLGEICAAYLYAQLEKAHEITRQRRAICGVYRQALADLESHGDVTLPQAIDGRMGNGHIFYLLTRSPAERAQLIAHLAKHGIEATFHYTPLHSSEAGLRYGRASGDLVHTDSISARLLRLPIFASITDEQVKRVAATVRAFYRR